MKILSAATQERALEMIKKYYFTENIEIREGVVYNTKLNKSLGVIRVARNRYNFHV